MTIITLALARTPLGAALRWVPGLEPAYNRRALQRRDQPHRLCGVYASRAAALAEIPFDREIGWNNEAAAAIWTGDNIAPVRPSSYPVFFWLQRLLRPGAQLLDYGGSVGLSYYGYRRRATLPDGAVWTVIELPLIAVQGRRMAEGEAQLYFGTKIGAPETCDILLASGSLQYMVESVPGLLELRPDRPPWVLLNKVPFSAGPEFWSLDNFGPAVAAYHVFNETDFLAYFSVRGYVVFDRWQVAEIRSDIAFHPEARITYHGFCLKRS